MTWHVASVVTLSLTWQVREGEAPSFFNAVEATVLVELIEGLLASAQKAGCRGVKPDDLGGMATYRKQVRCCRDSVRQPEWGPCDARHCCCCWGGITGFGVNDIQIQSISRLEP